MTTEYDASLEEYFLTEASDLLQTIEQNLFHLLEEKTPERVHNLMRGAHTIKGSAASCGFKTLETIAHHLEDVFQSLYAEDLVMDAELGSLLLEGYECLREPLVAIFARTTYDEAIILDRTASVFAKLQDKLGDFFGREPQLPSSQDLGFDVIGAIFSDSVPQDLQQLEAALISGDSRAIEATLREKISFFGELAASYELSGLVAIAETATVALEQNPNRLIEIAFATLTNLQEAYEAIVAGDRQQGGKVSLELSQLAGMTVIIENSDFLALIDDLERVSDPPAERVPQTIDTFARTDEEDLLSALAVESEFEFVDLEAEEGKNDRVSSTEIFAVEEIESENPRKSALVLANESVAITGKSPIDRLLSSISIAKPETNRRKIVAPPPPPRPKINKDSPQIRVAIEQLDSLSNSIAELSIDNDRQNLQSERLQTSSKQAFEHFLTCQRQLEKIRDWSDKNLLLPENSQAQKQKLITKGRARDKSKSSPSPFDSLELDAYSDLHILLQNLSERMSDLGAQIESIETTTQQFYIDRSKRKQLLVNAREDLLQARTVTVGTIFQRFPRLLQQMISAHHKPAQLEIIGAEVLVDKAISEKLYDPLLHLIRNAYDHGLEDLETRTNSGKDVAGKITLRAYLQGNRIAIEVSDDGGGLNWENIRNKALERNILLPSQADNMSEGELAEVLFEPGFSTANKVSDLSGRGVGLDVVRSQLQSIQGTVSINSRAGVGTTFTLKIPVGITTARLLVCQSQGITYAILSDAIERVLLSQADRIQQQQSLNGRGTDKFLRWVEGGKDILIPICQINDLIAYQYSLFPRNNRTNLSTIVFPKQQENSLLMLKTGTQSICLDVEQTLIEQELVIKSFSDNFSLPSYVRGYCVLGDGSITLVIDPIELINQQERASEGEIRLSSRQFLGESSLESPIVTEAELIEADSIDDNNIRLLGGSDNRTILVVEDSVVQRQSLVRSLSKAGYHTVQAGNGREALAQLQQQSNIDAIICDIEMPHMNGFEFLSYRRQDYRLYQIPTIMLTSRGGQKHREFALNLGANAYLTKPYNDRELLELLQENISISF